MKIKRKTTITPLKKEQGGGYLVEFPDYPGCMADGKTVKEALREGEDALKAWADEYEEGLSGMSGGLECLNQKTGEIK